MSDIIPFEFEGTEVRVISRDGEPWFVLADVCRVLAITNSRNAAARLEDEEKSTVHIVDGTSKAGGNPNITIINEAGRFRLILTSRKPQARRFQKWVVGEVLPAIRKTGGYMSAASHETPEELAVRALRVLQATIDQQKAQIAVIAPKAEALDRIAAADGCLTITSAAKVLQFQPSKLFLWLHQIGWIYKRPGSASWLGYQPRIKAGYLTHKVTTILRPDGTEKVVERVLITPKGLSKLGELLKVDERIV